jgi:uncharacterized integral membrane protein (TIGR00698 family)
VLPVIQRIRDVAPGLGLSLAVAGAATFFALAIGLVFSKLAERSVFSLGIAFCVKKILRWAVALLGVRIALSEIVALGFGVAVLVMSAMLVTILSGVLLSRILGQGDSYGVLAGAGTAVCGASATLATSTVIDDYPRKGAEVAFVVIAVNAMSTIAMVLYPPLCIWLGLSEHSTGIMLGGTIHDVAQVVGAGYATSEVTGNTATIVKLFRVFLLLPVVAGVGLWFARASTKVSAAVPIPYFALAFLTFSAINSIATSIPSLMLVYAPFQQAAIQLSSAGLLVAIGALGLGTTMRAIGALGWRHLVVVTGTTLIILFFVVGGLIAFK